MSEATRDLAASEECYKNRPDYFGYFLHEIEQLILEEDNLPPFSSQRVTEPKNKSHHDGEKSLVEPSSNNSGSLSFLGILSGLSDSKNERLKILLKEAVKLLNSEVDEVLASVLSLAHIQSEVRNKKRMQSDMDAVSDKEADQVASKKPKLSSSSKTVIIQPNSPSRCESAGEHLCSSACRSNGEKKGESPLCPNSFSERENEEVDDELQFLLRNDLLQVEMIVEKHSDELSETLGQMEKQLESLVDMLVSKCRPMSLDEKQELCKLIRNLPPQNLNRVAEIVQHSRPRETPDGDKIFVNLEEEENSMLWRLRFYVEAVEKAQMQLANSISTQRFKDE